MLKLLSGIVITFSLAGCAAPPDIPVIRFTDVQSRRTYRSIGSPSILLSGAVNFVDEKTGNAVTLQSWEAQDDNGRKYGIRLVTNPWTGKQAHKLVEIKKPKN